MVGAPGPVEGLSLRDQFDTGLGRLFARDHGGPPATTDETVGLAHLSLALLTGVPDRDTSVRDTGLRESVGGLGDAVRRVAPPGSVAVGRPAEVELTAVEGHRADVDRVLGAHGGRRVQTGALLAVAVRRRTGRCDAEHDPGQCGEGRSYDLSHYLSVLRLNSDLWKRTLCFYHMLPKYARTIRILRLIC